MHMCCALPESVPVGGGRIFVAAIVLMCACALEPAEASLEGGRGGGEGGGAVSRTAVMVPLVCRCVTLR